MKQSNDWSKNRFTFFNRFLAINEARKNEFVNKIKATCFYNWKMEKVEPRLKYRWCSLPDSDRMCIGRTCGVIKLTLWDFVVTLFLAMMPNFIVWRVVKDEDVYRE
jgi:hypothetical protein